MELVLRYPKCVQKDEQYELCTGTVPRPQNIGASTEIQNEQGGGEGGPAAAWENGKPERLFLLADVSTPFSHPTVSQVEA